MHPALLVDEIVLLVAHHLLGDHAHALCPRQRADTHSVLSLALVSKSFSHPSLDVLWHTLPSLGPLTALLKLCLHPNQVHSHQPHPRERERGWERFMTYALRVRCLTSDDPHAADALADALSAHSTFSAFSAPFIPSAPHGPTPHSLFLSDLSASAPLSHSNGTTSSNQSAYLEDHSNNSNHHSLRRSPAHAVEPEKSRQQQQPFMSHAPISEPGPCVIITPRLRLLDATITSPRGLHALCTLFAPTLHTLRITIALPASSTHPATSTAVHAFLLAIQQCPLLEHHIASYPYWTHPSALDARCRDAGIDALRAMRRIRTLSLDFPLVPSPILIQTLGALPNLSELHLVVAEHNGAPADDAAQAAGLASAQGLGAIVIPFRFPGTEETEGGEGGGEEGTGPTAPADIHTPVHGVGTAGARLTGAVSAFPPNAPITSISPFLSDPSHGFEWLTHAFISGSHVAAAGSGSGRAARSMSGSTSTLTADMSSSSTALNYPTLASTSASTSIRPAPISMSTSISNSLPTLEALTLTGSSSAQLQFLRLFDDRGLPSLTSAELIAPDDDPEDEDSLYLYPYSNSSMRTSSSERLEMVDAIHHAFRRTAPGMDRAAIEIRAPYWEEISESEDGWGSANESAGASASSGDAVGGDDVNLRVGEVTPHDAGVEFDWQMGPIPAQGAIHGLVAAMDGIVVF